MNKQKQIDLIRKKNAELSEKLEDMRFKLESNTQLNMDGYKKAKDLIVELETIKKDWISTLYDLNNQKERYSDLIDDLQKMKNIMVNMNFKIQWYKKIINKLKK